MSWFSSLRRAIKAVFSPIKTYRRSRALGEAYRRFEDLKERGRFSEAVPYAEAVLALSIETYGEDTSWTAARLNDLAELHRARRDDAKAEPLYLRALTIFETVLGPEDPDVAEVLNSLASLYRERGDLEAAEPLFRRALKIFTQTLGSDYPDVAISLYNLARIYEARGIETVAETSYRRAIDIWERGQGSEDLDLVPWLRDYARLLRKTERADLAQSMEVRAAAIEAKNE